MAATSSVVWEPITVRSGGAALTIRQATQDDVPVLERWDHEPSVIACTTDDPDAQQAFEGAVWADEIAARSDVSCYYIAELDGRPIGAMQVIDPYLEPTHYWGEIEPNLRAIDIWIGDARDRNAGHGATMMRAVIDRCFADPAIEAIVIDPLNSNTDAHRFYQRLGFKIVGRRIFGDDDCLVHRLDRADWRKGN
ncbi:MAG TPA: GNAT family N-acetyltransferase [Vitreimonas sp.]|uniref:GNAT family N-acetyltransferase n=1 Tax=Vitreimonas sp. TaxID=3069702 RepID=UPI002D55F469|nr:GNAT family N-acetyltransferase [Vitreimonas sp.]HYD86952.1 GNAT family N-acetyltransferase [Vitreimonas sp.]